MEEMANIVPTAVFVMGQPSAETDRVSDAVLSLCRQPESRAWTDRQSAPATRSPTVRAEQNRGNRGGNEKGVLGALIASRRVTAAGCFRFVEPRRDSTRTGEKARTGLPSSSYGFDPRRPLRSREGLRLARAADRFPVRPRSAAAFSRSLGVRRCSLSRATAPTFRGNSES